MAKQTFTTGQVLTAAQMTSLQQTAMLGGAASAKTASYTLVAADAGTAISMSNAGATTITVNTALFAAGDTVQITNLGAGVCTITAGTATVDTSASLALAQYESGTLDFTSTSAAIFIKGAGAAASSGGMTLISTTTLTGASVTLSSIPQTYIDLKIYIRQFLPATDNTLLRLRFNGDSTANRYKNLEFANGNNHNITYSSDTFEFGSSIGTDDTVAESLCTLEIPDYTNTVTRKMTFGFVTFINATTTTNFNHNTIQSYYSQTGAISSLVFAPSTGNFTSGTLLLYGVK
jgi:hypothetical protein